MKNYRLIALDMDGTVLNDQKKTDPETEQAIHSALAEGMEVVFCTGRSYAEMQEILEAFPDMHYLIGESGALVYDLRRKKVLAQTVIPAEVVKVLWDTAKDRDLMPCIFSEGRCIAQKEKVEQMTHFHMGQYQTLYRKVVTMMEDPFRTLLEQGAGIEKVNFYHADPEGREASFAELTKKQVQAELVYSEYSSLECSAKGLSKAVGLKAIGRILGISLGEMAMVGDADNDLEALKAAGLAVAMGNANEHVKAVCDLEVKDNNHQGCAEAVRRICEENYD